MKPYGMHRTGHKVHGHKHCGICSGDIPVNSSEGRAWIKQETRKEIEEEISTEEIEEDNI